jgi:hypothetical protein
MLQRRGSVGCLHRYPPPTHCSYLAGMYVVIASNHPSAKEVQKFGEGCHADNREAEDNESPKTCPVADVGDAGKDGAERQSGSKSRPWRPDRYLSQHTPHGLHRPSPSAVHARTTPNEIWVRGWKAEWRRRISITFASGSERLIEHLLQCNNTTSTCRFARIGYACVARTGGGCLAKSIS